MMRFLFYCLVLTSLLAPAVVVRAQDVPADVQQELDRRGMTLEEAQRQAQRLGIDLSNPDQAARRARELGVPEAQIQKWLQAAKAQNAAQTAGKPAPPGLRQLADRAAPVLEGSPGLTPSVLALSEDGDTVAVRVVLRDDASRIDEVSFMLVSPDGADTLYAEPAQFVSANGLIETWRSDFIVDPFIPTGAWTVRVEAIDDVGNQAIHDTQVVLRILEGVQEADADSVAEELAYFGYDTFKNVPEAFTAGTSRPAGDAYLVGPGDELRLTVWGAAEFQYDLTVDEEGRIYVPRAGQLTVAGRRLDALRDDVRYWLSRSYAGLVDDPPSVFMDLTVTRLRPVQLFVLGEVPQPGGYTLPSGSSVFSALYSVGGALERGSLRDVRVIRGDRVQSVDLYNFLLRGYDPNPVQLQGGDHVFIPPRAKTVAIEGAVKRPAYYEMREEETFETLLSFAGGLLPEAYTRRFQIERIIPFAERTDPTITRTVIDYNLQDVLSGRQVVALEDGDHVTIYSILERESLAGRSKIPAAVVTGAVFKPGRYELNGQVRTVRDLLDKADGLTGDAYDQEMRLVRLGANLRREIISLDLDRVLKDDPTQNLVLRPQDSLHVAMLDEIQSYSKVRIAGQVREPGEYDLLENMTVADLLFQAGGLHDPVFLKDVLLERADLYRRSVDGRSERIIPFDLAEALSGNGLAKEVLQPEDEIRVYAADVSTEVLTDRFVTISGAVNQPGEYRYRDGMTLEDLILQADGFEEAAYLETVEVTRPLLSGDLGTRRADQLRVSLGGSGLLASAGAVAADTVGAMAAARNFKLQHRDRVFVRRRPDFYEQQTITVRGEVRFPGEYTLLSENETLASLIDRAGGVLPTGYLGGGKLLRAGEKVVVDMDRALRGNHASGIILQDGDEITVPPRPNTVAVRGNVALEGLIKYERGKRVSFYLDRAGGKLEDSEAIYLTQASGATFRVKTGLFRLTPVVDDGAAIYITRKAPKEKGEGVNIGKTITDVAAVLSSALTIIVLGKQALK